MDCLSACASASSCWDKLSKPGIGGVRTCERAIACLYDLVRYLPVLCNPTADLLK